MSFVVPMGVDGILTKILTLRGFCGKESDGGRLGPQDRWQNRLELQFCVLGDPLCRALRRNFVLCWFLLKWSRDWWGAVEGVPRPMTSWKNMFKLEVHYSLFCHLWGVIMPRTDDGLIYTLYLERLLYTQTPPFLLGDGVNVLGIVTIGIWFIATLQRWLHSDSTYSSSRRFVLGIVNISIGFIF